MRLFGNWNEAFDIGDIPRRGKVIDVLLDCGEFWWDTMNENVAQVFRVDRCLQMGTFFNILFLRKQTCRERVNYFVRLDLGNIQGCKAFTQLVLGEGHVVDGSKGAEKSNTVLVQMLFVIHDFGIVVFH